MKEGGAGRFWLVTVGHTIEQEGAPHVEEEQDLVFRTAGRSHPSVPMPTPRPTTSGSRSASPTRSCLFRFSAVTANAHRIHYDHPYTTEVEGYPDLVVHGPLTAILLAELARTPSRPGQREVSYRARAPHFANRRFWLAGRLRRRCLAACGARRRRDRDDARGELTPRPRPFTNSGRRAPG